MKNKQLGFITGVIFTVMFLAVFMAPLFALLSSRQEVRMLRVEAVELRKDAGENQQIITAQEKLLEAHRSQAASVASILGQAAETLEGIAYGPYTREEIQAKVARVAEIIGEVNEILTPEELEEISQAIVHSAVAADVDQIGRAHV
mgnify:CR=1 FL=1